MSNEIMLEGTTLIIVLNNAACPNKSGVQEIPSHSFRTDDFDKAYMAVEAGIKAASALDENINVQWIEHNGSLAHERGSISIVCSYGYQVVIQEIRDRLKLASPSVGTSTDTSSVPVLVPRRDNHADREADADLCVQPPH